MDRAWLKVAREHHEKRIIFRDCGSGEVLDIYEDATNLTEGTRYLIGGKWWQVERVESHTDVTGRLLIVRAWVRVVEG